MLQFTNYTVFLTKTKTHKKQLTNKKNDSLNLPKSSSFTNLKTKFNSNTKKSTVNLQQIPKKKGINQINKNCLKEKQILKKTLQNIENTGGILDRKSQICQQNNKLPYFQKQNIRSFKNNRQINNQQKTQLQPSILLIKRRNQRSSNKIFGISQNKIIKKSSSFLKRQLNKSFKKIEEVNNKQLLNNGRIKQKEEIYYVDQLNRQIKRINLFDDNQNQSVPPIVGHFFQSISTFYRFRDIKQPDQPKISIFLPKQKRIKTTLIFDMDQTLIHAEPYQIQNHAHSWGQNFQLTIDDGSKVTINLKIRPFVLQVLHKLKPQFQIGVFTAANQTYAKQILQKLDPEGKIFDFKLFRQHCDIVDGRLAIKDLRILSNRSIKNIILVDNSPHTYLYQKENAIPILSFYNNHQDEEFLKLERFIQNLQMNKKQDVRVVLKNTFKFHKYVQYQSLQQLVQNLYEQKA